MPKTRELELLVRPMQRIFELIAEARETLLMSEATQWQCLALARWQLLRALDELVACKRRLLEELIRDRPGRVAERAAHLLTSNSVLLDSYRAFVRQWQLRSPFSVDARYKEEARQMVRRIERQLTADLQELVALVSPEPL